MNLSMGILLSAAFFYLLAFLCHLKSFLGMREEYDKFAFTFMRIGFLLTTLFLTTEAIGRGFFLPRFSFAQAISFFAWAVAFVYLVLLVRVQSQSFGLILNPILLGLIGAACFFMLRIKGVHSSPQSAGILLKPYFVLHIIAAYFAYASFTISFFAASLYLIQQQQLKHKRGGRFYHKLPSLLELDRLIYKPILWGVPLLFVAVGVGFLWAKSAFGSYWFSDPKTIVTAVTAIVYFAILYLRYGMSLHGKQVALLSLIAFAFVIFGFFGVYLSHGSHHFMG